MSNGKASGEEPEDKKGLSAGLVLDVILDRVWDEIFDLEENLQETAVRTSRPQKESTAFNLLSEKFESLLGVVAQASYFSLGLSKSGPSQGIAS